MTTDEPWGHSESAHRSFGWCAACPGKDAGDETTAWRGLAASETTDQAADLDQAYSGLEAAIRATTALEDYEGLVTDWIVLAAIQHFDSDGHDSTAIARLLPSDGRMPYYRMMGLIDYAHAGMRNEIRDEASFMGHDDDGDETP